MSGPEVDASPPDGGVTGVGVRTVTLGRLPLLLAGVPGRGDGQRLWDAVAERGLQPLSRVSGVDLPRGAELGFVVDRDELRLVDPDDRPVLRAARSGLDAGWLEAAKRLKGTMTVLVRDLQLTAERTPPELLADADAAAADGRVIGAIVGLLEERPQLPLLFG